jgi:YggT family protein
MLIQALIFLLNSVATAFVAVLLLRFHLQATRASFNNPLGQFAMALTDFAVKPTRRLVPGLWGLDLATLLLAWLVQYLLVVLVVTLTGHGAGLSPLAFGGLALLALLELAKTALWMVILLQFMLFVVSFSNPYSPYMGLLNAMNRPFTRRIQKIVPPIGNIDLSPMVVVLLCSLLLNFILPWLALQIGVGLM